MSSPAQPAGLRRAWLTVRLIHPFPTLVNVAATAGLAELATHGRVSFWRLLHLALTMAGIQATIGIVNDLWDRDLDRLTKPDKPLVSGAVSFNVARLVAVVTLIGALVLATGFGVLAWLIAMAGLLCGLLYDIRLKRTTLSAVPYVLALPLLPIWIWVALGRFRPALFGLIPLGLLLGLALHLANSLPDFEDDARAGVLGLAQHLGKRRALVLCWGSYALTLALVGASSIWVSYRRAALLPGLGLSLLTLLTAMLLYIRRPGRSSLQAGWGFLMLGGASLALGWLGALESA